MGEEILVRKKSVKVERRFLGRVDRDTPIDGDDDGISNFSLEGFFFSQQQQDSTSAVDRLADDDDSSAGDDEAAAAKDMTAEERRIYYWESQHFLLQEILEQYDSIGPKFRQEMKRQIEIARDLGICNCKRQCSTLSCLRRAAVNQLCSNGFNASLCVSHWKSTHYTPAGWHEYIEVRINSQGKKKKMKKQILFVVEVGFRDEFIMAKASEEYKNLIKQLPQIYIGKWEHMKAIIRLVCEAAKKSAEEQKIHMGPWRKKNFMQMKWSPSSSDYGTGLISRCLSSRAGTRTSSSSNHEPSTAAASSFHLPMPTSLKVA